MTKTEKTSSPWGTYPKGFEPKPSSDYEKIQTSIEDLSLKIDEHKKEHQENKNEEYEFQGNVAKEHLWAAFFLAIGSAFLSVGTAISFGVFEIINDSSTVEQVNWNFISAYQNMGAFMMFGGLFLILMGAIGSYRKITKLVNKILKREDFKNTSQPKIKNKQSDNSKPHWQIHLILGFMIIFFGSVIFIIPIMDDRPEVDRWQGFDISRQHNVTLSSLEFNMVTIDEKQSLHIFYATNEINGENPFLMFTIPYLVTMTNPEGNQFSVPGTWETYFDYDLKTTFVYKFFNCSEEDYCSDQYNMYFDFKEKVDSKQYYVHSINVPFLSPDHKEVNDARNKILDKIPVYQIKEDWGLRNNEPPIFRISVLDDSTEYNIIPSDGYLRSHKYNRTGVTNSVVVWDIPNHRTDFHLDYVNPHERYLYDNFRIISIVLFGTGTAFLVVSFSEYRNTKK